LAADKGYAVILHTTDGGDTWRREGDEEDLDGLDLNGVSAIDGSTAWAVGDQGLILHTTDGGKTWVRQGEGQFPVTYLYQVDAVDSQVVWVVGDDDGSGYATVLRTTDGGETWEAVEPSSGDFPSGLIDVSAIDAMTAWIVGIDGQGHRTIDGGATWETFQIIPTLFHVNGVCALDADTAWVATDQGGVYYTSDGGETWNDVSPTIDDVPGVKGYELLGVTTKDGQSVWISGLEFGGEPDGLVIQTTNGGTNWTRQDTPVTGVELCRISFVGACQ